jgi:anti-anti-sigma factor
MTTHEYDHISLLEPRGDLWESRESATMERMLVRLAERGRRVVVDLSSTGHLTAHGLGVLAHAQRVALDHGGEIALCGAGRAHRILLETTGLADAVKIYDARAAAVKALASGVRAVA